MQFAVSQGMIIKRDRARIWSARRLSFKELVHAPASRIFDTGLVPFH